MSISEHTQLLPGVPFIESPLFDTLIDESDLSSEEISIARQLNERGFAVIDFPDRDLSSRIDRIKTNLAPRYTVDMENPDTIKAQGDQRIQDAWRFDDDVRAIATNRAVIGLLEKLYGRRAFPFQTLNFPVGTQQAPHSDSIHFSSLPERFMCGVWVAFEDVHPDAGPLVYYPGSHRWPVLNNAMIGQKKRSHDNLSAQTPFEGVWQAMARSHGIDPETFLAKKGQALIWMANLLHGGSPQANPRLTRWSQVTHYYFADCIYYTPAYSDEPLGRFDLRVVHNIATDQIEPNSYLGETLPEPVERAPRHGNQLSRLARKLSPRSIPKPVNSGTGSEPAPNPDAGQIGHPVAIDEQPSSGEPGQMPDRGRAALLPPDFDRDLYMELNPDVAKSGMAADVHYLAYGCEEGRRYRE